MKRVTKENVEDFIKYHRMLLHSSPYKDWKLNQAHEKGFTACLDELEKYINEPSMIESILEEIVKCDGGEPGA